MADFPPTKRKHRATHGRRRAVREATAPPVDPRTKQFDGSLANEIQLLREYKKSWDRCLPLARKLISCPIHERPFRLGDYLRRFKFEQERIDAFIENRPEPSQATKRIARLVLEFEEKLRIAAIPESERIKTEILDQKIAEHHHLQFLEFQKSKLESEAQTKDSPYAEKYERLHKRQEEMLRRNLGIPNGMATPPRTLEEVEARVAELKAYNESLPLQPYYTPRLWENIPALDKIHSEENHRELIRGAHDKISAKTGRLQPRYFVADPSSPRWDIVNESDKIVERYNYEDDAIAVLKANPNKGLRIEYRGPDLDIMPRQISKKLKSPWFYVYDKAGNVVNRFRSSVQAHAFAHDNGLQLTTKTEYTTTIYKRKSRAKHKAIPNLNIGE